MRHRRITFTVVTAYLWVMWILLGSIVLETFMIYPNIFHDVPASLEEALRFMSVRAPSDFFPPLGLLSWVTGAGSVLLTWGVKPARYWIVGSLLMIVWDGLFSMAIFWPRNTVMFAEGTAVHSPAVLVQTAREFQTLHWSRLAFSAAGSVLVFIGFLRLYRRMVVTRDPAPCAGAEPDAGPASRTSASRDARPERSLT
jgi:hypothetical protein